MDTGKAKLRVRAQPFMTRGRKSVAQVHNHLYPYQPIKAGPGGTHTPTRDGKEACRQSAGM
ncbi:Beige/BEACH domain protein (plasmid) [Pseudomonas putida]|uniref:Beige/BEACH domain protein n=1 Tax=Pseudomonas putida TaxID=303 RepID=A0A1L7NNT5_PSEPU|nr:Beige/BEACH domain protein [Pseudomonas putida]